MLGLTVLSPHRDDALFSLALALSRWSKFSSPITVLNFFTVSSYAPLSTASSISAVSTLRRSEDRRALYRIDPRIKAISLGFLDAPLRMNISVGSITALENEQLRPAGETRDLARSMQPYFRCCLVLAPLALANHIDHRAVYSAALTVQAGQRLGFYEDLPYATWVSGDELATRLAETERATGVPLKPLVIQGKGGVAKKRRDIRVYRSQIRRNEADVIARYASRFGGGERIWIPRHGKLWRELLSS